MGWDQSSMLPDFGDKARLAKREAAPALEQQTSMASYYWRLLRQAPGLAARAGNGAVGGIGVVVTALFLVNRKVGEAVASWDGVSPWWALVPFGALLLFGLMRANHLEYVMLEKRAADASKELASIRAEASGEAQRATEQRQILIASLARRRTLGRYIFDDIDRIDLDSLDSYFEVTSQVFDWRMAIHDSLAKYSWVHASLFDSDVGLPDKYDPITETKGSIRLYAENLRRELSRRLMRLDQVIEKIETEARS